MTSAQTRPSVSTTRCRLRPTTFFSRIVTAWPALLGRLHALAVEDRSRRLGRFPCLPPHALAQLGVQMFPGAVVLPLPEVMEHDPVGRQIVRQAPPGATVAH